MSAFDWWPRRRRPSARLDENRWVVVDVETSGLDPAQDALLAIAAIGVQVDWSARRMRILPGDSLELVVRPDAPSSRGNILLHGIGVGRQMSGLEPVEAMRAWQRFAADSPLLAFHAAFDQTILQRYCLRHLGAGLGNPWLDIEHLCAATHPEVSAKSLDDWMARLRIVCAVRHQAAADAWAECEVLQSLWPPLQKECRCWRDVVRLAERHRWLSRH